MSKKIVYITGCLGFIGIHITQTCLDKGWYVIGVDKITYASNKDFLEIFNQYKTFKFINADINDLDRLYDCDYIINTAAETHVDNSIENSDKFVHSNINGVHNLLKLINEKPRYSMPVLLHFSTDEVYGDIEVGSHLESDILRPSNPYSATKAAADMLVMAWGRTFKIPYIIVRPTNNYGIGQYTEKFIPKNIKNLSIGKRIPLHQQGTPRRTWLHVSDTASAVITIIESNVTGEIFNISGNYEEQNLIVSKKILDFYFKTDNIPYENYLDTTVTRPGQDVRYSIDDSKLMQLGWSAKANFDQELESIVEFYTSKFFW